MGWLRPVGPLRAACRGHPTPNTHAHSHHPGTRTHRIIVCTSRGWLGAEGRCAVWVCLPPGTAQRGYTAAGVAWTRGSRADIPARDSSRYAGCDGARLGRREAQRGPRNAARRKSQGGRKVWPHKPRAPQHPARHTASTRVLSNLSPTPSSHWAARALLASAALATGACPWAPTQTPDPWLDACLALEPRC